MMLTPYTYVYASKEEVCVFTNSPEFINELEALSCTVTDDLEPSEAYDATSPDLIDEKRFDGETTERKNRINTSF